MAGEEIFLVPEGWTVPPGEPSRVFSDLEALRSHLREQYAIRPWSSPLTIHVRGGRYPVRRTFVLKPEDSIPVELKAVPGETPIFDGGIRLGPWTTTIVNGREVFTAKLPADRTFQWVDQLIVNDRRKKRSAWPKSGLTLKPKGHREEKSPGIADGGNSFALSSGDFDPEWFDVGNIDCLLVRLWTEFRLPVDRFDAASGTIRFTKFTRWSILPEETCFQWENVREALTEPGEFYFDRPRQALLYVPEPGETAESIVAEIPGLSVMLMFDGDVAGGRSIRNWHFSGIHFRNAGAGRAKVQSHFDWTGDESLPSWRNPLMVPSWLKLGKETGEFANAAQGAVQVPGMIVMRGTEDCSWKDCVFEHSNGHGIVMSDGTWNIDISRNTFRQLGGGAIYASGAPDSGADSDPTRSGKVTIANNHIHDCGLFYWSSVGILLGHARGNLVEHNHIHDMLYTAISCGWSWGYVESPARENRIGFNNIHDIGKGRLCDMGGIYCLGIQPGTRIYHNRIARVMGRLYGGWGIYLDEGSSHFVIENNVCHDFSNEAFHQHYGRENIVRNNILAFGKGAAVKITGGPERKLGVRWPGVHYTHNLNFWGNVLLADQPPYFRCGVTEALQPGHFFSNLNWFHSTAESRRGAPFALGELRWETDRADWQEMGHDTASRFGDPGFVDVGKRDFRLKSGAPLLSPPFRNHWALTLETAGIQPPPSK